MSLERDLMIRKSTRPNSITYQIFNKNDATFQRKTIAPLFVSACAKAGFKVAMKGWEGSRNMIRFVCPCLCAFHAKKKLLLNSEASTSLPDGAAFVPSTMNKKEIVSKENEK